MAFKRRVRENLLIQSNKECQFCGYNEFPEILEAAHIVKHSENPDANEEICGMILCPNCHKIYDKGLFTEKHFEEFRKKKLERMNPEMRKYHETGEWPSWVK